MELQPCALTEERERVDVGELPCEEDGEKSEYSARHLFDPVGDSELADEGTDVRGVA